MAQREKSGKNRLQNASSPYLLQHAGNPVDWHEWGEEAFEEARRRDVPVFLSIGYSTCHWCHVMERESFENEDVAELMNDAFVNIKVDREERPDIDNIYMTVCQMVSPSCGWPLTVVMTPDREPFYVATYIPREEMHGRPGIMSLVPALKDAWKNRRGEITSSAGKIINLLSEKAMPDQQAATPSADTLHSACQHFVETYDELHGGFGSRPKFPSPHNLVFLIRYAAAFDKPEALKMASHTLEMMRKGGIWDYVGFGFHRYSTDRAWFLPHFEKMLYDQAMLMLACTEAWLATGKNVFKETAEDIFTYLERDLSAPEGGFYSAEDADSEGEEGKFYVWTTGQLQELLEDNDFLLAYRAFGVTDEGTYREEATGEATGANILFTAAAVRELAKETGEEEDVITSRLEKIRLKLLKARGKRIRPGLDDKILTDWNGLLLAALSKSAMALHDSDMLARSEKLAAFLLGTMRKSDGSLLHRYREGEAGINGFIDDYVFLTYGLTQLFLATGNANHLSAAAEIMDTALEKFWDDAEGGFYFAESGAKDLLVRKKELYDGAIPSANSLAVETLFILSNLTGNLEYSKRAEKLLSSFAHQVKSLPAGHSQYLTGLMKAIHGGREIVIVAPDAAKATALKETARQDYHPFSLVFSLTGPEQLEAYAGINPLAKGFELEDGRGSAYVCGNFSCKPPVHTQEELESMLNGGN